MQKYKLAEVCKINPKDTLEDLSSRVSFVPMQSVSETGDIDVSETRCASEVIKGFTSFKNGDVLMAKITPCMENGKGAVATGLCNGRGLGSTEFFVLRPDYSKVRSEWIYYYTVQKQFRLDCERNMTGSAGQKRVPKTYLENREIPIPSLAEQDHALRNLSRIKKIINYRQQQLQKLDELIKARFVEMFGDCLLNKKGWKTRHLGDIAEVGSSKRVFVEDLKDSGIPFYRGTEIGALAEGKSVDPELFISKEHYSELCKATGSPSVGDLLMPSICPDGRIWVVNTTEPFYFKDGRVLWVHDIDRCYDPIFLLYTLKDRIMTDYSSIASGTTFAELKIFALKECQIFDVPIDVQNQFATFVEQTDKSKVVVQKALDEAQLLFDSLMQEYFG